VSHLERGAGVAIVSLNPGVCLEEVGFAGLFLERVIFFAMSILE